LAKTGGMALGVVPDTTYHAKTRQLQAGDQLFLYTDGVTEAMDRAATLFSDRRLREYLTRMHGLSSAVLTRGVLAEVHRFAAGAVQSDDITALAIQYIGNGPHEPLTLRFTNARSELARLAQGVTAFAEQHRLPSSLRTALNVVLEEVLTNVTSYGYDDTDVHEIILRLSCTGEEVRAEVEDDGRPFNPLAVAIPDTSKPLAERPVGGLGIHLVRQLMDSVEYCRQQGKNVLVMTKRIPTSRLTEKE
jgi:sigma-B regulation protein RsbU (phosphoserine phosphatase)